MNILYITAVLPYPLHSGGQVRMYNLLRILARRHTITLASFIRDTSETEYLTHLGFCREIKTVYRGRVWNPVYVTGSVFGKYPLLYASYDIAEMRRTVAGILENSPVDMVQIEPSYVWPSLPPLAVPVVVSEHNIEYRIYDDYVSRFPLIPLRPVLATDVRKHEKWEKYVWRHASHVTAVSETDAGEIRSGVAGVPVTVVPNGVDIQKFTFNQKKAVRGKPVCLFAGNFRWIENRDAVNVLVHQIWPEIKSAVPSARLRIVGRHIPKSIRSLISDGIEIKENVADIAAEYQDADVLLAPIRVGGGTKFKILEAMAAGLPVITTYKGIQGLPLDHQKNVYIAESPRDWVSGLRFLMGNSLTVQKMRQNSRILIEKEYTWDKIAGTLETVWKKTYEAAR